MKLKRIEKVIRCDANELNGKLMAYILFMVAETTTPKPPRNTFHLSIGRKYNFMESQMW